MHRDCTLRHGGAGTTLTSGTELLTGWVETCVHATGGTLLPLNHIELQDCPEERGSWLVMGHDAGEDKIELRGGKISGGLLMRVKFYKEEGVCDG